MNYQMIRFENVTHIYNINTAYEKKALDWADEMSNQGYSVTITFDQNTGEYTCVAEK